MNMNPIIQILSFQQVYCFSLVLLQFLWILSDNRLLVKIALSSIHDSIKSNYHAYINIESISNLPFIECGTIPQQRYHLSGQSEIHQISISLVESVKPVTQDERFTSSDESPAEVLLDSNAFEVIGIGVNPFLCFYEVSRTSVSSSLGSSALSFSKSIYGAIKSLAG